VSEPDGKELTRQLTATLNKHGYAFQHAVIKQAHRQFRSQNSLWMFESIEFPVETQGRVTHIDIVMKQGADVYLVGECKRVDPSLSLWCFVRAPHTRRDNPRDAVVLELLRQQEGQKLVSQPLKLRWPAEPYHISLELRKQGVRGDGTGGGRGSINEAIAQALQGASGLADHFHTRDWATLRDRKFLFVPVVFTTAELWTTEADLGQANLESGHVAETDIAAKQVDWLWFNYNLSPHLRHSIPSSRTPRELTDTLLVEATRSVAIVSPSGLQDFLAQEF
jgi:hypothetical protein